MKRTGILSLSLALLLAAPALPLVGPLRAETAQIAEVEKDVPYVPTPEEVVTEMLRMAQVGKDDVLYDLGCGDGRIVVTAAKEKGARGVGVDIDPERIRESRENARDAGVSKKVKFVQGDLFTMDFRDATVLTLYLLPDVNLRLRPKILKELRPGTRVVSHDFHMDEWKPDRTAKVGSHEVYFWIVPANASGSWEWAPPGGKEPYRLTLDQSFQEVSGTLTAGGRSIPVTEGRLQGDRLRFVVPRGVDERSGALVFEGRIRGDTLEGTMRPQAGGTAKAWNARRDPATVAALDGK